VTASPATPRVYLTDYQVELLRRIAIKSAEHGGIPATLREIVIPYTGTHVDALAHMRDLGLVDWDPNKVRTLRLTDAGRQAILQHQPRVPFPDDVTARYLGDDGREHILFVSETD
jgi:hypothetical protein